MTLALTLGLSALNTLAQENNDRPRPSSDTPRGGERMMERAGPRMQRPPAKEADRERPAEARPMPRRWGGPGLGPPGAARGRAQGRENTTPMRRGVGPQERFGQGGPGFQPEGPGPGFGARGRGRGFGPPMMGRRGFQQHDGVCPFCGRSMGPLGPQSRSGRGGPGFGPGGRGPGFGPPQLDNRGTPPSPRGGFGPMRRGPGSPESRVERGGPGPQPEGRGPTNRPPMEHDNR
jgi:hypothetical protein